MKSGIVATVLALVLSGCLSGPATQDPTAAEAGEAEAWPESILLPCTVCVEPTVAWAPDGALLVDDHAATLYRVTADGTYTKAPLPVLDDEPSEGRVESETTRRGDAVYHAFNGIHGFDDSGSTAVYDNRIHLFRDDGDGWEHLQTFDPGSSLPATTGGVDRLWTSFGGDLMVMTWNLNGFQGGIELVASRDGGETFGPPHYFPPTHATLGSRAAVSDDGTIIVPTLTAGGDPFGGEHVASRPDAGGATVHVSDDGETWDAVRLGPWVGGPAPGTDVFVTGATWSPALGFVLTWQSSTGTVWGTTSPDGRAWDEPEPVWEFDHPGVQPFAVAHDDVVTLSVTTKGDLAGGPVRHHVGTWNPLDGTTHQEQVLDAPGPLRIDFAHHAVRADGTVAYVLTDGSDLRVEVRNA